MVEQIKTDFLRNRMIQLREKNNYSLSQMAAALNVNKSTLSRVEKTGGSNFKTVDFYARKYCEEFKMSEKQINLFLRGERAVLVDTSALMSRHTILDELCEEYSCVYVPNFVVDELAKIENENPNDYGRAASNILRNIYEDERIYKKSYSIPTVTVLMIIDLANALADDLGCFVDIVTYDYKIAIQIEGSVNENSKFDLVYLDDYVAEKQNLVNMSMLNALNEYYSDSYDDVVVKLKISLPNKDNQYLNAYLIDGNTLIISAINNKTKPLNQRIEKIRWLIKNGADINKRDCGDEFLPPISHAIRNRDYEMFSFLFYECKANPNVGSKYPYDVGKKRYKNNGNMPLMIAAWNNQVDIVKALCSDSRVNLNQQDGRNGYTALIKACYWGFKDCRKIIEDAGADTSIVDHMGLSAQDRWKECLELGRYKERIFNA